LSFVPFSLRIGFTLLNMFLLFILYRTNLCLWTRRLFISVAIQNQLIQTPEAVLHVTLEAQTAMRATMDALSGVLSGVK
jgi:hypothetical protein